MTEKRFSRKQHHTFANKKNIELGVGVGVGVAANTRNFETRKAYSSPPFNCFIMLQQRI